MRTRRTSVVPVLERKDFLSDYKFQSTTEGGHHGNQEPGPETETMEECYLLANPQANGYYITYNSLPWYGTSHSGMGPSLTN